jgi:hypothetical protein
MTEKLSDEEEIERSIRYFIALKIPVSALVAYSYHYDFLRSTMGMKLGATLPLLLQGSTLLIEEAKNRPESQANIAAVRTFDD